MKILVRSAVTANLLLPLMISMALPESALGAKPVINDSTVVMRGRIEHIDLPMITISDRGYLVTSSTQVRIGNQSTTALNLSKGMAVSIKAGPRNADGIRTLLEINAGR